MEVVCLPIAAGKSHALHKRVEQLCIRAIRWGELKRKTKVLTLIFSEMTFLDDFLKHVMYLLMSQILLIAGREEAGNHCFQFPT